MKKLKSTLSLFLVLVMVLALAPTAFAADTLTGNQLHPKGDWGNGPSLTLKGVTGETETKMYPPYIYDVEVGGSLVLEMPYPEGKNRIYSIMIGGFYITPDFNPPDDNDRATWDAMHEAWDLPASSQGGDFDESSGKTRYVYNFTEADMGQKNGLDKVISVGTIYWCDDANRDGMADEGAEGSVYFGIRVVPATSKTESIAYPSTQTVDIDGKKVEFQMYALKDANGYPTNYIKARDLALALNGTKAQFAIEWDGKVNLVPGRGYTPNGSENKTPFSGERAYTIPTSATNVNGSASGLTAIFLTDDNGGGYTYYQLRDLGKALGFNVGWSGEKGAFIETDKPYDANN